MALVELAFARTLPLTANQASSSLLLVEASKVRLVAARASDDPFALVSSQTLAVPSEYEAKCAPLKLAALAPRGERLAVAGQRGFCLWHKASAKWRLFGNVNEEHDMACHALAWLGDDVVLALYTRASERHDAFHLHAFPRNHLDDASSLAHVVLPRDATDGASVGGDCYALTTDASHVYVLSTAGVTAFAAHVTGALVHETLAVTLAWSRNVNIFVLWSGPLVVSMVSFAVATLALGQSWPRSSRSTRPLGSAARPRGCPTTWRSPSRTRRLRGGPTAARRRRRRCSRAST